MKARTLRKKLAKSWDSSIRIECISSPGTLGVDRLLKTTSRGVVHKKRYSKTVPGHQVQVDIKLISFEDSSLKRIKQYQYTAIDDGREWISKAQYQRTIDPARNGETDIIDKAIGTFKMSRQYRERLLAVKGGNNG